MKSEWRPPFRGIGGRRFDGLVGGSGQGRRGRAAPLFFRGRRRLVVFVLLGFVMISAYVWPSFRRGQLPSRGDGRPGDDVEGHREEREREDVEGHREERERYNRAYVDHHTSTDFTRHGGRRDSRDREKEDDGDWGFPVDETLIRVNGSSNTGRGNSADPAAAAAVRRRDEEAEGNGGDIVTADGDRRRNEDGFIIVGAKAREDASNRREERKMEEHMVTRIEEEKQANGVGTDGQQQQPPRWNPNLATAGRPGKAESKEREEDGGMSKPEEEEEEEEEVVSDHPIFGRRRLLDRYDALLSYVNKTGRKASRRNIEVWRMPLAPDELALNAQVKTFRDMSGKYASMAMARCLACADGNLLKSLMRADVLCDRGGSKTPMFPDFCYTQRYTAADCVEADRMLREEQTTGGGWFVGSFEGKERHPYLVRLRGGAFVTKHGQIYNDDVMFDFRGTCRRAPLPAIFPDMAKERRRYKKVYVIDHVWPGLHHEIAEAGGQLMGYYRELMDDPDIYVHTTLRDDSGGSIESEKNLPDLKPTESALRILESLGINRSRVVGGDVYAEEEVVVAEGYCFYAQWLYGLYGSRLRNLIRKQAALARTSEEDGEGGGRGRRRVAEELTTTTETSKSSPLARSLLSPSSSPGEGKVTGDGEEGMGGLGRHGAGNEHGSAVRMGEDGGGQPQRENGDGEVVVVADGEERKPSRKVMAVEDDDDGYARNGEKVNEKEEGRRRLLQETDPLLSTFNNSSEAGDGSVKELGGGNGGEERKEGIPTNVDTDDDSDASSPAGTTMLLIKRSKERRIANHDEVVEELEKVVKELNGDTIASIQALGMAAAKKVRYLSAPPSRPSPPPSSSFQTVGVTRKGMAARVAEPPRMTIRLPLKLEVYDDSVGLTPVEIWARFAKANVIIGAHGAGFTNILAARPGTILYEMVVPPAIYHADSTMFNFCFRMMSFALGFDYHVDFPDEMYTHEFEFDSEGMKWFKRPGYMVVNASRLALNLKNLLLERLGEF